MVNVEVSHRKSPDCVNHVGGHVDEADDEPRHQVAGPYRLALHFSNLAANCFKRDTHSRTGFKCFSDRKSGSCWMHLFKSRIKEISEAKNWPKSKVCKNYLKAKSSLDNGKARINKDDQKGSVLTKERPSKPLRGLQRQSNRQVVGLSRFWASDR